MKKNENIGVLIIMILLLCLIVPGAIYGTYMHFKDKALGGNPNKEFFYNGKLYFFDNDTLLGTYTCNSDNCGYATNSINNYEFEIYNIEQTPIKMINNKYAFIKDNEIIKFYDIKTGRTIIDYKEIKNYSVGINSNNYLIKNVNDKWGMLNVSEDVKVVIPFQYDYLGLINKINNNEIDSSKLIAKDTMGWKIIDSSNNIIINLDYEIINYSDNYVIAKHNEYYKIFDFNNNEILNNYSVVKVELIDKLVISTINNGYLIICDGNRIIKTLPASNNGEYSFKVEDNNLMIMQNNNIVETIAIS